MSTLASNNVNRLIVLDNGTQLLVSVDADGGMLYLHAVVDESCERGDDEELPHEDGPRLVRLGTIDFHAQT